ncbi:hypothetical protein TruAng_005306 [Truncatella angustata]|nr:hypothetical protein TruAng_005306 [Truncatella angustata]
MHQQDETAEYERLYADRSSGEKSDGSFDDEEDSKLALPRGRSWWLSWRGWILHLGLPLVYTVIFIEAMSHVWRGDGGMFSLVESPAKYIGKKTHLEVFPLDKFLEGPYTGQPGPELDEVWGDLLQYYYFPNATAEMRKEFTEHAEHCLELFRMSAMCRGDVSVLTHRWVDGDLLPHVNQSSPHQCVDWSQVMDFAESASVDVFRKDYIINPETGTNPYWHE